MRKLIKIQKAKKEEASKPKAKIQEVESVAAEEPEEEEQKAAKVSGKTKTLDAEVINKAVEIT